MANTAHFRTIAVGGGPAITVRDDRGIPLKELDLPQTIQQPDQADEELRAAGYRRSADWTEADDGWVAPIESAEP